jgi:recombination protein RecA
LASAACPRAGSSRSTGRKARARRRWRCTTIAEAQKKGGICAFVDAEHALDPVYARKLGVDLDELLISQPDTGEQALEITDTLVRSGAVMFWWSTRWRR